MPAKKRRTEFGDFWKVGPPDDVHRRLGNAWWAWLWWVHALEHSAAAIRESASYTEAADSKIVMPTVYCVRAMLLGYAVECALKGLWVRRGNTIVQGGKYTKIPNARDHDLLGLARTVGFHANAKESDVLKRLSNFASFAGRYPIAKTPDAMLPNRTAAIGPIDVAFFSKQDFRVTQSILNKVIGLISGKKRRSIPPP